MPYDPKQALQIAAFIEENPHVRTGRLADWANEQKIRKYTSRISDARALGYVIEAKQISNREFEYTVHGRPQDSQLAL